MSQEFQVLQCFSCQTFQVHIIKKILKWNCKMCGEKQSVKKIFGNGTGKECRQFVQELNATKGITDESIDLTNLDKEITPTSQSTKITVEVEPNVLSISKPKASKWSEFVDRADDFKTNNKTSCFVKDENCDYTFNRPQKRRKLSATNSSDVNNLSD